MSTKSKKRKFNFKRFFVFLLIVTILMIFFILLNKVSIKNILVKGNYYLTDEYIIETAKLESYPKYLSYITYNGEKKIKENVLIKDVSINKTLKFGICINIEEYKVLFKIRSSGEYVLNGRRTYDLDINAPVLINYVEDSIIEQLIDGFSELDYDVINKISEIEYSPSSYDDERFILYMNDSNMVYITLDKIEELKKYNKIKEQLGNHIGILYLDSGNYFEIKE